MLTDDEKRFVDYWALNREREHKVFKQWLLGLPLGMVFGLLILVNFFSGWYKQAAMDRNSKLSNNDLNPLVLIIALLLIISFIAIFSKRHKWEMNEQQYKELKAKDDINVEGKAAEDA